MKEKHIYIIGSKGIPAKYGGFETFVEELTAHQSNKKLKYHVACLSNDIQSNFIHNYSVNLGSVMFSNYRYVFLFIVYFSFQFLPLCKSVMF